MDKDDIKHIKDQLDAIANLVPVGRWLTMDEAMRYAKVKSRNTMMKWINGGHVYAHKRTGEWIIDRQSIDKWFESEIY
jgi:hypothetical protein